MQMKIELFCFKKRLVDFVSTLVDKVMERENESCNKMDTADGGIVAEYKSVPYI